MFNYNHSLKSGSKLPDPAFKGHYLKGGYYNKWKTPIRLYIGQHQPRKALAMSIPFTLIEIELRCRFPFLTKTLVVKKDDLISIDIFKPPVIRTTFRALKLDLADLKEHVGIKRKNGFFKQLRFTPENPKEFVSKAKEIFELNC